MDHDQARARAYRWNEDGLGGVCDAEQRLCLALALWNGQDPILKERPFGLTGNQGNRGEDLLDVLPEGVRSRVSVVRDWPSAYLTFRSGTRLITGGPPSPRPDVAPAALPTAAPAGARAA